MTAKKFVLSIYPYARCNRRRFSPLVVIDDCHEDGHLIQCISWTKTETEKLAWIDARKLIEREMLLKLEQC